MNSKLFEAIKSSDLFQPVGDEEASKREAVAIQKIVDSFGDIYEIDKRAARDYVNFDKISKKQSITYKLGDFSMQFSNGGMALQVAHNNPIYAGIAIDGQHIEMRFVANVPSEKAKFGIVSTNADSVTGKILMYFSDYDIQYTLRSGRGESSTKVAEKYIEYVRKREGIKE